jgi:anthranilate phosphoribosyltransferase
MTKVHEATDRLKQRHDLSRAEARALMEELLSGSATDSDIMAFLVALGEKGEQAEELVGFAEVMRGRARELVARAGVRWEAIHDGRPLLDTCGTGGDARGTINVSTAAALVAAAAGVRVAKHGNRSISSRSGSADVLEALGVSIGLPLHQIARCLEEVGMVFLFAPAHHLAMKHVMKARRALKTRTVFNLLGPLTNPLGATVQLVGLYDRSRTAMYARALLEVGTRKAFVVAGHDGLDEISTTGPTQLSEAEAGRVSTRDVTPEDFGLGRADLKTLEGGEPAQNAEAVRSVLGGRRGPCFDLVIANASAALVVAGKSKSFREGVSLAAEVIDSGAAQGKLQALVAFTQKYRA